MIKFTFDKGKPILTVKPEEVRIGNFLMFENKIITVEAISQEDCCFQNGNYHCRFPFYYFNPIPIDENIIKEFGFVYGASDYNVDCRDGKWFFYNDSSASFCYTLCEVKSVHHLQNIYYTLTGDELKKS